MSLNQFAIMFVILSVVFLVLSRIRDRKIKRENKRIMDLISETEVKPYEGMTTSSVADFGFASHWTTPSDEHSEKRTTSITKRSTTNHSCSTSPAQIRSHDISIADPIASTTIVSATYASETNYSSNYSNSDSHDSSSSSSCSGGCD